VGSSVTEQRFWGLTLMPELRSGLGARWDGAPRAPGICCLGRQDSNVAAPNGLFLVFLGHRSLVDRHFGVLGCSL
jgi:hypothetical protein